MTLAIAGKARLLVIETRNPQIASPKTTAITIPPIHFLESAELDSRGDMFRIPATAWLLSAIVTHPTTMGEKKIQNEDLLSVPTPTVENCDYTLLPRIEVVSMNACLRQYRILAKNFGSDRVLAAPVYGLVPEVGNHEESRFSRVFFVHLWIRRPSLSTKPSRCTTHPHSDHGNANATTESPCFVPNFP